jgi:hypothetical protein
MRSRREQRIFRKRTRRIVASVAMVGALGMSVALATASGANISNQQQCEDAAAAQGGFNAVLTGSNPKYCTYQKTITGSYWTQTHAAGVTDGFQREVFFTQTNTYQFVQDSGTLSGPNLTATGTRNTTGLGDCLNPAGQVMPTALVPNLPVCSV